MPVKIRLSEGHELTVDVDADEWTRAFQEALATGQVLQVADPHGRVLTINPQSVAYYVEEGSAEEDPEAVAREPEAAGAH